MEAVGPAPAIHHAAGKLVDDDNLVFLDDIVGVALEDDIGLERLVEVLDDLRILEIVEIAADEDARILEHALDLLGAVLGEDDRLLLLVDLIVLGNELLHDRVDRDVELGLVVGRTRDDERRSSLRSEEHTSELQSLMRISYAVFCLKKK